MFIYYLYESKICFTHNYLFTCIGFCFTGEFDITNRQAAVGGAQDFSVIVMVESGTYTIRIYDLSKVFQQFRDTQASEAQNILIKSKAIFNVTDSKMLKTITDTLSFTDDNADECGKRRFQVCLSPTKDYFMVTYQGQEWLTYMYSLNVSTWSVACMGLVCSNLPCSEKYPSFTHDGTKVVYAHNQEIVVISSKTCQVIQKFDLSQSVKDFVLSGSSDRLAVLHNKSVLTLKIDSAESNKEGSSNRSKVNISQNVGLNSNVLIERTVSDTFIQPELVIRQKDGRLILEEVKDLHSYADTDRIASARSKKKRALISFFTPNGLRTIQFHRKVQVVDTKVNEIKYTPKKGDIIVRAMNRDGSLVNENIPIPGLTGVEWNMPVDLSMNQGDRIVGENGKVKIRVNQEPSGQYRIQNVPSVLSVYSVDNLRLTRLSSITTYEENVVTVGNEIVVTTRDTANGHFINIYSQTDGKLKATHKIDQSCTGAKVSNDGIQLFVIDASLTVYLHIGPDFNSVERKVSRVSANNDTCIVKDMLCFGEDRNALLLFYTPKSSDIALQSKYCHVNLVTKQYGPPISVSSMFDDISLCGNFAIDSKLEIYDLPKGEVKCRIQYQAVAGESDTSIATDVQITARFIDNGKRVIFLDRRDETLHLASIESQQISFSAFYHVPEVNHTTHLQVVKHGIFLMKTDLKILVFVLLKTSKDDKVNEERYHSEKERASMLVSRWADHNKLGTVGQSMYIQRELLKQNLLEALPAIEAPIERDFQKQNPERPQVLVISGSLLPRYFVPSLFSKYLKTEQISVTSSDVALARLTSLNKQYDVILLQLITDDVTLFNTEQCVSKVSKVVETAKKKSRMVILCLAPCRGDGSEINAKTQQVNTHLDEKYKSETTVVHICRNDNLSENGKPIMKFFQDGVTLSAAGTKQITINYKDVMLPLLGEHYSVGQKKKPKLQSSGNRIV